MIEKILILIIQELGPVGLMIVGFWYISHKTTQIIIHKLDFINDEINTTNKLLQAIGNNLARGPFGKN